MSNVDLKSLSPRQLLELYNEAATRLGRTTVARFADAETALRRTTAILADAEAGGVAGDDPAPQPASARKAKAKPAGKAAKPKKERCISEEGAVQLYPVYDPNPRRFGSFGFASYEIVRKKPGITKDDFVKAGGRAKDLLWDMKHGNISTSKVSPKPRG